MNRVGAMELAANAKINLFLEVIGRRPDGYHDILTILQTIALHDTLTLEPDAELELVCDAVGLCGENNLALSAARRLRDWSGTQLGARMTLRKRIPEAAGLGGGSSDAAAALLGLNELWSLGLSKTDLMPLAAELGADVPFFLHGGTALAEGKGETVTPLPSPSPMWVLLVIPKLVLERKTAYLYGLLSAADYSDGDGVRLLADSLRSGMPLADLSPRNTFQAVVERVFPVVHRCRKALLTAGATIVGLSGSGPTLFTLASERAEAERLAGAVSGPDVLTVVTVTAGTGIRKRGRRASTR